MKTALRSASTSMVPRPEPQGTINGTLRIAPHCTLKDRVWLLQLLGPRVLAELTTPLTDKQAAQVNEILDLVEKEVPVHSAVMAANKDELPATVEWLLR